MKSNSTALITVDCIIDKETFIDFSKFHRFYAQRNSWNIIIFPVVLLGFAIINWCIGNNTFGCILLALSVILPVGSLTAFYLRTYKQVEVFKLNTPRVFYSLSFHEERIQISNKKEKVNYEWSKVYKIYRTKCSIYLYITPMNAFIIPSDSIKDYTIDDLWTLFQKHLIDKKLIFKK